MKVTVACGTPLIGKALDRHGSESESNLLMRTFTRTAELTEEERASSAGLLIESLEGEPDPR
jgi:hypothetical protein